MKLSLDHVRSLAAGVLETKTVADGVRFHRFPSAMWDLYAPSEGSRARAACTTGVRLRFRTNSRSLRLSLRYGEFARWYFLGAMRVDADRIDAFGPVSRQEIWTGCLFEQAQRQSHDFDIWLPHLSSSEVLALELEDGCAIEPAPALSLKWLAYGDSITQGMNATLPLFTWTARVALALRADAINLGVGGATCRPELAACIPAQPFDLITVSYGANEFNIDTPAAVVAENTARLLESLQRRQPAARLVVTTPVPFFRRELVNACGETLDAVRAALEQVAARAGVPVLRGTDLVPADHVYFNDRSHPNDAGMLEIAKNVLAGLQALGVGAAVPG